MRKTIAAIVALFLAMLGLSVLASPASATHEQDCTTETTGWLTQPPTEDDGWKIVDERTVTDKEAWEEVIVISEPIEGQHYSYTGGPIEGQPLPPSEDPDSWQANTHQEPHINNPNVTWVDEVGVGLHYTSHGSSGLADWFYYQAPVPGETEVIYHEAITHTEYKFEREVCVPIKHDDPKPEPKPEPKPDQPDTPKADKPELPHTGPGSTALLALLGTSLITAGSVLYRKFS
jgi:LPXTG-motif cell wall-anchored protein